MADLLEHRGYQGTVEYSAEDGVLIGKVLYVQDVLVYHGESILEITKAFVEVVDSYLAFCKEHGKKPNKPFKGIFNVRVNPELHRRAVISAERRGVTLNALVGEALEHYLQAQTITLHASESNGAVHMRARHMETGEMTSFTFDPLASGEERPVGVTANVVKFPVRHAS